MQDINNFTTFRAPVDTTVTLALSNQYFTTFEAHKVEAPLRFDPVTGTSRVFIPLPEDGLTADLAYVYGQEINNLRDIIDAHAVLCRWSLALPQLARLEPRPLDKSHVGIMPAFLELAVSGTMYGSPQPGAYGYQGEFPDALTSIDRIAWFAPGVDQTEFGTYYLVPTGSIRKTKDGFGVILKDMAWSLGQVGVQTELASAAWNDVPAIASLIDQVLTATEETGLVMASLKDAKAVSSGKAEHDWRHAVLAAREKFVGKNLRPKLVSELIPTLAQELDIAIGGYYGAVQSEKQLDYGVYPGLIELDDYRIFNYSNVKKIAACYIGMTDPAASKQKSRKFLTELIARLAARKLGTVYVTDDLPHYFWITAAPNLLNELRPAFGIPADTTLIPATSWLAGTTDGALHPTVAEDE